MKSSLISGLSVQTIRSEAAASCQTSVEDGIPKEIKEYCDEIGEKRDICPELLEAIAYHESRFKETVTNKTVGACVRSISKSMRTGLKSSDIPKRIC